MAGYLPTRITATPSGVAGSTVPGGPGWFRTPAASVGSTSGYYTRPEIGQQEPVYAQQLQEKKNVMLQSQQAADSAGKLMEGTQRTLEFLQHRSKRMQQSGTAEEDVLRFREEYDKIYKQWRTQRLEYAKAASDYERNVASYNASVDAYNNYAAEQEKLLSDWRGTVRDRETVKADLEAIESKIDAQREADRVSAMERYQQQQAEKPWYEKIAGYLGGVQDTTLPTYSVPTGSSQPTTSKELQALLDQQKLLQEEYDWAQHYYYAELKDAADFSTKSQYASTLQGSGVQKYADLTYEIVNKNNDAWSQATIAREFGKLSDEKMSRLHSYSYMTDEEVANYNYCYAIGGKDAAEAYLNRIQEELNAREAGKMYEKLEGKTGAEMLFGIAAGFDQADSGLRNLFNTKDDYIPYSSIQIASGKVREDLGKVGPKVLGSSLGQIGYDTVTTASNMAPSFLTSLAVGMINPAAGAAVGNVMMGASAAGNAYREKLNLGYTKDQARTYGLLVGASEALLEKALGGISKLGGGALSKTVLKNIGKFDNVLTKFAKSTGGQILMNAGSEALEEGLQSVLEPYLWKAVSNEEVSVDWEEAAYSALLGFVTGGVAESTDKAITHAVPKVQAKAQTLQEAVQQQVAQRAGIHAKIQEGSVELAQPTVQYTQQMWDQSNRLAKLTGRNIRLYEDAESVNGSYDPKTGLIWVNTKGNDVFAQVFSHEMTHSLEEAGLYEKLSSVVLNRMQDTGINLDNAREAKRQQYARQGHALQNDAEVDQELVAEYVSRYLLTDEQSITDLVQKNRTLGQRIVGWFDGLLAKMGNKNAQERVFLSRARSLYIKALRQTQGVGAAQQAQQTATSAPMGVQVDAKAEARGETAGTDDDVEANMEAFRAAYIRGEVDEATYDQVMDSYEQWKNDQLTAGERKYSLDTTRRAAYDNAKEDPVYVQYQPGVDIVDFDHASWAKSKSEAVKAVGLISEETQGLSRYVGGSAYAWNASLRGDPGYERTAETDFWIQHVTSALKKFPNYEGRTYRNLRFANDQDLQRFLAQHNVGDTVETMAFMSTSKDPNGYVVPADYAVHMVVDGASGRDISESFGIPSQKEVVYLPGTELRITDIRRANDGNYLIFAREVTTNGEKVETDSGRNWKGSSGAVNPGRTGDAGRARNDDGGVFLHQRISGSGERNDGQAVQQPGRFPEEVTQRSGYTQQGNVRGSDTVSKKDVARELQAILQRGGDVSELRRYVAQLEGSGGKAEQSGRSAEQKRGEAEQKRGEAEQKQGEAEQILEKAKRRGVSVEQYLQENAEQYESDSRWNADARKALELEKKGSGRKWSVSEGKDAATEEKAEAKAEEPAPDLRSSMPKKAKDYLKRVERDLLWTIADKLSVPKLAGREYLQPIIQEMSDVYLREGTIPDETVELLFEKAYAQGVVVDAEFYNAYKHIKDHLRNLRVTISDRDKADIADFSDFRRRAFGTLKIVNEGGLPVDTAYQELHSMAPELFPESIAHPADQLVRMCDAARSIQVTEKTVQDYYGEYEPEYRRGAKLDFEEAMRSVTKDLWTVKRYAEDKASEISETAPATEAEANEAYKDLKKARRAYEKAAAKNLLSSQDEMQVGRLLRHEIELEHLDPEKDNVKGITAVFEAKQEYDRLCKLIAEYKKHLRGKARQKADAILATANDWKDKKLGIAYSRETMERNIYDIVKDKKLAKEIIDQYFKPVHEAEAAATRFKNDFRDRVRAMDLSRKVEKGNVVSEAHAVQLLGEAEDNIRMLENAKGRIKNRDGKNLSEWRAVVEDLWKENPGLDKAKIEKAVKDFRYIYDTLFQEMNRVRVANGYEPVNYRNGYFPHFQPGDSDSILAQFGRALGIDTRIDALPTTINGLTHTFKPGIQWMGNAQERIGFNTAYDAVEGFDKYIEGVAGVIYQTQNIQNLRALASQIRYRTSDEGIREQVDAVNARTDWSEAEKQVQIADIYSRGKFTLSNFVTELDEYTNLLANKKSRYDRSIEAAMGRKAYAFLKAWEARVGANMIAGNLTSALTNFIPLTQAGAQMDRFALLNGMLSTLKAYRSDDGIVNQSTFLTNRRGSDPLVQTWAQKASEKLGKPMEWIDGFVSGSIVRGAYAQNLKRGMNEAEAMAQADAFAASVMADRSKGAMPTLMQASNPLFKAFTQFQLEVNNQFSEVFKDIPRRFKEKGLATLAWVLLKYFLGAWLYNELYEELIGRRPALDPIGMLCEAYDDLQNDGFGEALISFGNSALEQLPFSAGLTIVGVEIEGGRIPATSAVPNFPDALQAIFSKNMSPEKRWKEVQDELNKLAYVVPPFGGNQVSKAVKGVKAYIQGGSYNVDADGSKTLQYPVYKDDPKDAFWNLVQAAFLGKSSLETAQEWVDSEFKGLNAKQTDLYQQLMAAGAADREAFQAVTQVRDAGSKDSEKLQAVRQTNLTNEEKQILVGYVLGTDMLTESGNLTQYAKFSYAMQNGMDADQYIEYRNAGGDMDKYLQMRDAGSTVEEAMAAGIALVELKGSAPDHTAIQAWRTVIDAIEDPERQLMALSAVMTESQYNKALTAKAFGVAPELYVQANELLRKYDADGNGRYTQGEVTKALGAMKCSSSQKAALWQLITGSSSAKSNPYSAAVGQRVVDALNKAKSQEEETGLSFQDEIMRQIMGR